MRIRYTVLWIDDNPKAIEREVDAIRDGLDDLGFELVPVLRDGLNSGELADLRDRLNVYNPYDMVFFDYDLGTKSENGADIAKGLRSAIFTDMVFYSSVSPEEMRKQLYEKRVDGVYILNRVELSDMAMNIIEDQVKRICDLNSMRGMILDEVSAIDIEVREWLADVYSSASGEQQQRQAQRLAGKVTERAERMAELADGIATDTFEEAVRDPRRIEFSWVLDRLDSLKALKRMGVDDLSDFRYLHRLRNEFGHQVGTLNESTGRIDLADSHEHPEGFDHDTFRSIRQKARSVRAGIAAARRLAL